MSKIDFKDKVVWVTGASTGIGRALSLELDRRGAILAISARREDKLKVLSGELSREALVLPLDVSDELATRRTVQEILATLGRLDVAVLNAGTSHFIDVDAFDTAVAKTIVETNILSIIYGSAAVLPSIRETGGQLVLVGSIAGYGGMTRSSVYCASKAAVRVFGQSLQVDLAGSGAGVSVVSPGFVKTPLTDKNEFEMPFLMTPEKAAKVMANGISKRKLEIIFPKFFARLVKFVTSLPVGIQIWMMGFTRVKKS